MGMLATARAMPGSTKIKRGIGLVLLAVLAWAVLAAVTTCWRESTAGYSLPATLLLLIASFAIVGCLLAGLVLLIWGLLRG